MGTINNLPNAILADVGQLALPALQNIQTAFNTIAANQGNAVVAVEQEAVIVANVNQLIAIAPALLPLLQSQAISLGATQASTWLGQIITQIQALQNPTASSKK